MLTVLQPQSDASGVLDDIDHLFLLPERALTMDSSRLQKDLAGLDFDPRLMHAAPMGNVWLSGAVDTNAKQSRPYSAQKARSESVEEREQRLKMFRDKQNEERQRKLEELKAQALAAQRFREMKEEERRKRIEELRVRDQDRRQQVGERKRLIYEAERDRRESILKKNMEREARFELKKRNERSSLTFAFGSSTPRMLEPADTGGSFWGHRRATSTNNIMFAAVPLTRRSSERELDGSKKRATSAGGLDRGVVDDMRMSTSMYEVFHWGDLPSPDSSGPVVRSSCSPQNDNKPDGSALTVSTSRNVSSQGNGETIPAGCASGHVGRRRTDLMPTIPSRDSTSTPVRKQPFTKSPGPSRPDSSLSHQSTSSVSSTVNMRSRPVATPRKPRPVSIAVTGVTHDSNKNSVPTDTKKADVTKPPLPRSRKTSVGKTPEKTAKLSKTSPKATPKATPLQSPCTDGPSASVSTAGPQQTTAPTPPVAESQPPPQPVTKPADTGSETKEMKTTEKDLEVPDTREVKSEAPEQIPEAAVLIQTPAQESAQPAAPEEQTPSKAVPTEQQQRQPSADEQSLETADMTASMIAKVRITTEEEAKAALAERRRLAREEAERQAEAERLRIEAEIKAEQERQRQEEEQLRLLAEQQRHAEEERLAQAIKEAQKREEEERLRREEELRQKLEKEEQERKAREESEKQRIEMQERLKQEEKEREARRKRVEAIMLRTRASKGSPGNNQPKEENEKSDKGSNDEAKNNQVNNKPTIESYEKQVSEKEAALFNGSFKSQAPVISKENGENGEPQHSNGHRNGVDMSEDVSKVKSLIQRNVTNTLIDLGEIDPFKNANTSLDIPADKISNEDSVNSNKPAESHGTTDFLL